MVAAASFWLVMKITVLFASLFPSGGPSVGQWVCRKLLLKIALFVRFVEVCSRTQGKPHELNNWWVNEIKFKWAELIVQFGRYVCGYKLKHDSKSEVNPELRLGCGVSSAITFLTTLRAQQQNGRGEGHICLYLEFVVVARWNQVPHFGVTLSVVIIRERKTNGKWENCVYPSIHTSHFHNPYTDLDEIWY